MPEIYADSIEAKVDGTNQIVPIRDITKAPAIIASASGESIKLSDSGDAPLTDIKLYGKSKQDGEPSPENLVPINIPGEDGSINVDFTGNQLFDSSKFPTKTQSGATVTNNGDGSFTISGTGQLSGEYSASYNFDVSEFKTLFKPGTVHLSGGINEGIYTELQIYSSSGNLYLRDSKMIDITEDIYLSITKASFIMYGAQGSYIVNKTFKPMLYQNGDGTWEPFKEPQQLIISTPTGLPGIPVDSGGNYTDANGQQWISDIYDAIAGEYHHYTATIESYNGETITTPYISTTGALTTGAKVIYALETPTVDSVESFAANSYYPNTNIFTDDTVQPGMEADYVADTKLYIDNKVSAAVTQAVTISRA